MMSNFRTFYSQQRRVLAPVGSRIKIKYVAEMTENGSYHLVEAGQEDLYEYIQSFRDSCDINVLIARFASGETDVFSKAQGFFADVSNLPDNMHEIFNIVNQGRDVFSKLPVEVKEQYNNSFEDWLLNFDFNAAMEEMKPEPDAGITDPEPGKDEER